MKTFTFILVLIVGVVIGVVWSMRKNKREEMKLGKSASSVDKDTQIEKSGTNDLIDKEKTEKENNKNKILEFFKSGLTDSANPLQITNNDVEKLIGVSDATAERYLNELEQEGKIKQIGLTGQSVHYELQ